ncbi:MAG: hypothetical protein EBU46_21355, partial [Nitrosomonadaceae bacterium]|nr:hypothetical protein [Nitrosomonadaceae bacterium]
PLEPAAGVRRDEPAPPAPLPEAEPRLQAERVHGGVGGRQQAPPPQRPREPLAGELARAVVEVLALKDAGAQHLRRRLLRAEAGREVAPGGGGELVTVIGARGASPLVGLDAAARPVPGEGVRAREVDGRGHRTCAYTCTSYKYKYKYKYFAIFEEHPPDYTTAGLRTTNPQIRDD